MSRLRCLLYALGTLVNSCVFLEIQRFLPVEFPRMLLTIRLFLSFLFFFIFFFSQTSAPAFFIEGNFYPWNNDMKIIMSEIRRGEVVRYRGKYVAQLGFKVNAGTRLNELIKPLEYQCRITCNGNKFPKVQWQEQKVWVKGYFEKDRLIADS